MWTEEFIKRYNYNIGRIKKAEEFMSSPSTTIEQVEKWLPEYNKVVNELSKLMREFKKKTGYEMSDKEIFNGF